MSEIERLIEPHVYFERSENTVIADVDMGLGVRLRFYSDEPSSPRAWEFEEIEVLLVDNPASLNDCTFTPRRLPVAVVSGQLYDLLNREWDRVIGEEGRKLAAIDAERRKAILG